MIMNVKSVTSKWSGLFLRHFLDNQLLNVQKNKKYVKQNIEGEIIRTHDSRRRRHTKIQVKYCKKSAVEELILT
jgi:hypothetical protein